MKGLFDLSGDSPEDTQTKKRGSRRAAATEERSPEPLPPAPTPRRAAPRIGVTDGEPCEGRAFGQPCLSTAWDIVAENRGRWHVACAVCGDERWVPAIPGTLPKRDESEEFVLRDGRFAGLTLAEAAEDPSGIDVLRVYARKHASEDVRKAVSRFLDSRPSVA